MPNGKITPKVAKEECHFENILAEMKDIFAALTAGSPVFREDSGFPREGC